MVIGRPVTTVGLSPILGREQCYPEAHFLEQPGKEAIILEAEAAAALVYYLVVQNRDVDLYSSAAVYRQVFKRQVTSGDSCEVTSGRPGSVPPGLRNQCATSMPARPFQPETLPFFPRSLLLKISVFTDSPRT